MCIHRQESAEIRKKSGIAKIVGTILCVGGAMLLSFYQGKVIGLGEPNINWSYLQKARESTTSNTVDSNPLLGPIFIILSTVGWAAWFIIQVSKTPIFLLT